MIGWCSWWGWWPTSPSTSPGASIPGEASELVPTVALIGGGEGEWAAGEGPRLDDEGRVSDVLILRAGDGRCVVYLVVGGVRLGDVMGDGPGQGHKPVAAGEPDRSSVNL